MALQVWLPLTQDTRNQGLLNLPTPWDARSRDTGGKLGQYCYSDNAIYHINNEWLGNTWSLACWVKSSSWGQYNDIILAKNATESTAAQFYLSIIGGTQLNIGCNAGSQTLTINYTFATDTWYHVAATYNGTILKLYLNGNEVGNQTYTSTQKTGMNNLGIGCRSTNAEGTSATGGANKRMNDIRIYDNCLTPEEVKKIAQGLVLHYSLSDPHIEGTTNLVTTESGISDTCYNGAVSKYGYGTETDMYKTFGTFEGRKCVKVYMGTTGLDAYPYVYFDNFSAAGTTIHTLSFDYFPTLQDTIIAYSYNGAYNFSYTTDKTSNSINNTGQIIIPVEVGRWNHITITAQKTDTTNTSRGIGYIRIGSAKHTSNTSNYWLFSNIQVEAKDHATAYVGPNSTRIPTMVYDTSGFNNNGTIYKYDNNGDIIIDSNTPKYSICTHIKAGNPTENSVTGLCYIYGNCSLTTPNQLTISFWCKPIHNYQDSTSRQGVFCTTNNSIGVDTGTDYNTTAMHHRDSMIDVCQNGGTHDTISTPFVTGEWHHYTFLYNGQNIQWYKDGIFQSEKVFDNADNLKSFSAIVVGFTKAGGVYRKNDCYMSDFRIYATALSAEDILDLYNNTSPIRTSLPTSSNLWAAANQGIINKTFTGGLNSYTQSNCQVTLTDDGYRIYRPPNITYDSNDSSTRTMWGGFLYRNSKPLLLKGHTYMIKIDIKGQTSNGSESYWSNEAGWSGGAYGLGTEYIWIENGNLPANWSSSDYVTRTWRFVVTGNTYKECITTYSSFYVGNIYPVFRDFKFGFSYGNTGALGTDLYIKNIRLYDITYETDLSKFA